LIRQYHPSGLLVLGFVVEAKVSHPVFCFESFDVPVVLILFPFPTASHLTQDCSDFSRFV